MKSPSSVTLDDELRLRLAAQAAGCAAFDWDIAAGTIRWDGATDILPLHLDTANARSFLDGILPERRDELQAVLESRDMGSAFFLVDIEIASALGAVNFTLAGTRMPDDDGRTARLVGLMRDTTERSREVRRLTYLATRDELTGHLNRNALREELSQAIESAKAENRNCAFLVASIDRLAMINDSFGFDAGDEVILGVGERLARTLRGSDIIGRTAGNKFGVLLKNCREREIAVVAARLRAAVRANGIETRSGLVAATCSVGAVWLPQAASTSQEAMLRAEQALDKARANGRDGFAVYQPSPQRETARLRQMQIADEVVLALKENRLKLAYQPIVTARSRKVSHYECLLRMIKPDGSVLTAGHFVPATEQMGIVHLVDRFALEATIAQLKAHAVTLAVNVSGTAAVRPGLAAGIRGLYPRREGGRAAPDRGADRNRRPASFRGECPVRFAAAGSGRAGGDRRFRRRLYLVPQPADAARRYRQDRRLLCEGSQPVAGKPGLRAHPGGAGAQLRHQDGGRMGGLGRRCGAAAEFRRRLFPGLPLRRAGAGSRVGLITSSLRSRNRLGFAELAATLPARARSRGSSDHRIASREPGRVSHFLPRP